ncbi:MAG: DegT/DnrJ/EryC1/StrS family aminotransferase [Bacillota bacterium]|nr:DegT/DnrJ/EryC1/StrS family aminotransferase [Bacillota bacterium]
MAEDKKIFPITKPVLDKKEVELVEKCLNSGWVTQGPMTQKFEQAVAKRHQVEYALAVTSCTAALHLSTLALGLKPGDEVIVPAFTWITSANCVEYAGAKVVFVDVKEDTFNLDPKDFEAKITPCTRAVVVVHLFGLAAEMKEILEIANRYSIKVIEDCACAIGTTYNKKPVGGLGNIGCFSFHPRKVITTGEGGMITTNDPELARKTGSLRNHGASGNPGPKEGPAKPYIMGEFDNLGFNYRLSDIQAAVGLAQMDKLENLLDERASIAMKYMNLLSGLDGIILPPYSGICGHTYQSYVIRLAGKNKGKRNKVMEILAENGIQTRPGTHAVHRLGYYTKKYGIKPNDFPVACNSEDSTITLPIYHGMTQEDQDYITEILKRGL